MTCAREELSALRLPRTNIASPLSRTTPVINLLEGLILRRSVHQRNFGRGAGYPRPIRFTQKLSFTSGVKRCGVIGRSAAAAALRMQSSDRVTHAATIGFSTSVSVLMTCTGLQRWWFGSADRAFH